MKKIVHDYFTMLYYHRIFTNAKQIWLYRPPTQIIYSETANQIISITDGTLQSSLRKPQVKPYLKGRIKKIKLALTRLFGEKHAKVILREVDILIVLIFEKVCKPVYGYIRRLNRLNEKNGLSSKKHLFMIFNKSLKTPEEIAGVIYKSIYYKLTKWIESIEEGFQKRNERKSVKEIVKPFNHVETQLKFLRDSQLACGRIYHQITGKQLHATYEYKIQQQFEDLKKAKIIRLNSYEREVMYG